MFEGELPGGASAPDVAAFGVTDAAAAFGAVQQFLADMAAAGRPGLTTVRIVTPKPSRRWSTRRRRGYRRLWSATGYPVELTVRGSDGLEVAPVWVLDTGHLMTRLDTRRPSASQQLALGLVVDIASSLAGATRAALASSADR